MNALKGRKLSWRKSARVALGMLYGVAGCTLATQPEAAGDEQHRDAGKGAVASALTAAPDPLCTPASFSGHDYWFCPTLWDWQTARSKCQAIGYDLAVVENVAENQFVLGGLSGNAWIGGRDSAVEGAWRWVAGDAQFWQGAANGTTVGGAYQNWQSGQPNNSINQDCSMFLGGFGGGKWSDDNCGTVANFVCEGDLCPLDPNKTDAGQCGCAVPDSDTDGDGTADCVDGCPNNASKTAPGICGCATPDIDTDADGTADCNDGCPSDPQRTALPCSPDMNCSSADFGGRKYFFCTNDRSWQTAQTKCKALGTDFDLTAMQSAAENDFVRGHLVVGAWIGGNDITAEGVWRWASPNLQFWQGARTHFINASTG